jgi:branched-chain amino acid transport system ATP-binding protein
VGRNGAGKTTTIESIIGLLPVRSGNISFLGEDLTRLPAHEIAKKGIGFSPEDCGLFSELSVRENLQIGQWQGNTERARAFAGEATLEERVFSIFPEVMALIERGGLDLSGGQRKMVAISRAMFLSPLLLLIDEPFEGLAPVVINRFRDALVKIREMGVALLMAESNFSHAALVADRLYAIDRGEIIFEGNPDDTVHNEDVMKVLSR